MINKKLNILIVDDDELIVNSIVNYLENKYNIFFSKTFDDTLNILERKNFDAFILDISLENKKNKDGIELLKYIKTKDIYLFTPVIFVTSYDEISIIEKGFKAGAVDYLKKPINNTELEIRLKVHILYAKSHEELLKKYEKLNEELISISSELSQLKKVNEIKEENFQNRESVFKSNHKTISNNKEILVDFDSKIKLVQEKLKDQQVFLKNLKKDLLIK